MNSTNWEIIIFLLDENYEPFFENTENKWNESDLTITDAFINYSGKRTFMIMWRDKTKKQVAQSYIIKSKESQKENAANLLTKLANEAGIQITINPKNK